MRLRSFALALSALLSMLGAASAQLLDSGYDVVRLQAQGLSAGGDRSIVDINDFGQVLTRRWFGIGGNGWGASFSDDKNQLFIFTAKSLPYLGTQYNISGFNYTIGVTNLGRISMNAPGAYYNGAAGTNEYADFIADYTFITSPTNSWFPQALSGSYSLAQFDAISSGSGSSRTSGIIYSSINPRTGDIAFLTSTQKELYTYQNGSISLVMTVSDLPAQYTGATNLYPFFGEGREGNQFGGSKVAMFDDGSIGFLTYYYYGSYRYVALQVDALGQVSEIFAFPEVPNAVAINERREIAFLQLHDGNNLSAGIYVYKNGIVSPIFLLSSTPNSELDYYIDINNRGEVVFTVNTTDPVSGAKTFQLNLWDPARQAIIPLATNAAPPNPGATDQFYTAMYLGSWSLSDSGQLALAVREDSTISPEGFNYASGVVDFYRFDPPGTTPVNPIMPGGGCAPDRFCFPAVVARWVCGRPTPHGVLCGWVTPVTYFDPIIAIGYDYEAKDTNTLFGGVVLPNIGDGYFDLYVWNQTQGAYVDSGTDIQSGVPFDFTTNGYPNGLDRFSIRGIETTAAIDPDDPQAFVTGLSFANAGSQNFEMIPLRYNTSPQPGDIDGDGDVDTDDVNLVLSRRNKPASGSGDPMDLDADGVITALDARKVTQLCTRPRCATQ